MFGRPLGAFEAPVLAIAAIAIATATTSAAAPPPTATTSFRLAGFGRPTGAATGAQLAPFHRVLPSGAKVVSHFWPSQYHLPSGEICPGSPSPIPYSHDSQLLIQARLQYYARPENFGVESRVWVSD